MFRYLTVILLFVAFSAQTFSLGWLVLDYSANKTSYQSHCENKTKPMMLCHGKCKMYKKLQSEQQKEQQFPESKGGNKIDFLCSKSRLTIPAYSLGDVVIADFPLYIVSMPTPATFDIFHPPA
jgi:hypothetical protein